jgi:hypothetical protein
MIARAGGPARLTSRVARAIAPVCAAFLPLACSAGGGPAFTPIAIAEDIEGAYLTALGDLNADSRLDVILLSVRSDEVLWFENPSWKRHSLVRGVAPAAVGAAVESGGSGAPRIVLLTGFNRDDYQKNAGELVFLRAGETGDAPFVFAREPAAHRAAFGDIDGDGVNELVVAPIAGPGGGPPIDSSAPTPLVYFDPPDPARHPISELAGTVHGLQLVDWDDDGRLDILTAGYGGVWRHWLARSGGGWMSEEITPGRPLSGRRKAGAGDIRVGRLASGERFLATIESVHGGDVAVYRADTAGVWRRRLVDDRFELAHGFAVADFDGDGGDEIVVSDSRGEGGVFLYQAISGGGRVTWKKRAIDARGMAAGACEAADLTGDDKTDLVCAGLETRNLKLYVNEGGGD